MKKLWAVKASWLDEANMGMDNIKLFKTRAEARQAKKNLKSMTNMVKRVEIHRWFDWKGGGGTLSLQVFR